MLTRATSRCWCPEKAPWEKGLVKTDLYYGEKICLHISGIGGDKGKG